MTRTAISPRLAMRTLVSTAIWLLACRADVPDQPSPAVPGARFADVRWVDETGSTNADAMELARQGEREGIVLVADHQTAGRGRAGSHLDGAAGCRPAAVGAAPPTRAGRRPRRRWRWRCRRPRPCRAVAGLRAAPEVAQRPGVAGRRLGARPQARRHPRRGRLAGGLGDLRAAGRSRPPHDRAVVVVGIGINVTWPADLPDDLADIAVAINHVVAEPVDREDLLIALLEELGPRYDALVAGDAIGAARRVAIPVGHARPHGAGRPRRRRRRGQGGRRHRRGPPRGRDRSRAAAASFAVGDVVHLR